MYENGEGVPQDYQIAIAWFRKAADQGYANAQYILGLHYALGKGVLQNYIKAHMWLNLSSSNGHKNAAQTLHQLEG